MNNASFRLCLLVLLTSFYSASIFAEDDSTQVYWVVGSFTDQPTAMQEGARISQASGMEVSYTISDVNEVTYYRLLTLKTNNIEDKAALQLAGIGAPWPLRLDWNETRSVYTDMTMQLNYYLVLGSFVNYADAQQYVEKILDQYDEISEMREVSLNDRSVIRVVRGPYQEKSIALDAQKLFQQGGLADVWLLSEKESSYDMSETLSGYYNSESIDRVNPGVDRQAIMKKTVRSAVKQPANTINPGFNLARLKRKSSQ